MRELDVVGRAAADWRAARERFEDSLRQAVSAGASLSEVAVVAGLSRSRVWQIVRSERSES